MTVTVTAGAGSSSHTVCCFGWSYKESHGQRSLAACSPQGPKGSDTTEGMWRRPLTFTALHWYLRKNDLKANLDFLSVLPSILWVSNPRLSYFIYIYLTPLNNTFELGGSAYVWIFCSIHNFFASLCDMKLVESMDAEPCIQRNRILGGATTEDEMVGWHHWLNGHECEQALQVGDGQGSLACCSAWGCRELDMTEQLNWTDYKLRSNCQLCSRSVPLRPALFWR